MCLWAQINSFFLFFLYFTEQWPCTPAGLPSTSGTTSSACFIMNNKVYVGHVGDSRIVLGRKNPETGMWIPHALTQDHKPESPEEKERIEKAGGEVSKTSRSGAERVVWFRPKQGHRGPVRRSTSFEKIPFLAVARSLGDLWSYNPDTGCYVVSPEPDVSVVPLNLKEDKCLILASDGLWNMLMDYESVRMVQELEEPHQVKKLLLKSLGNELASSIKNPSQALVEFAIRKWNSNMLRADNTSAITILLSPKSTSEPNGNFSPCHCKEFWIPGKQIVVPNLDQGPCSFELSKRHPQFYLDTTRDALTPSSFIRAKVVSDISYSNPTTASCVTNTSALSSSTNSQLFINSHDKLSLTSDESNVCSNGSGKNELDDRSQDKVPPKTRMVAQFTLIIELDEDCDSDAADETGLKMNKACSVLEPLVDAVTCISSNPNSRPMATTNEKDHTNQIKPNQPLEQPAIQVNTVTPSTSNFSNANNNSNGNNNNNSTNNNGLNLLNMPKVTPLTENVMKLPKSLGSVMNNQLDKIHMVTRSAVQRRRQNKWYINTSNLPQNQHHLQLSSKPKRLRSASRYSRAGLGLARSICSKALSLVPKSRTLRTRRRPLK